MAMSIPQDETARVKRAPKQARTLPDSWLCGLFLAPSGLILALMVFYPFFSLIYYSTLQFSMMRPRIEPVDVGLGNYVDLLNDNEIWQRFAFTGKFVLATVLIQFTIGLAVAYAFQRNFKGRDFLFTLALLPMMLCPIVVGFLWR
jgi:multiple sugar transport system permease protein